MFRRPLLGLLALVICVSATPVVRAEVVHPPGGLSPNDLYRYVFVTSVDTNAANADVTKYNDFAVAAGANINFATPLTGPNGSSFTWKAIVSTPTIDARDNTETNPNNSNHADVPIYTLDGQLVASGNADLWDGSIGARITTTELETTYNGEVWTGSGIDGTIFTSGGTAGMGNSQTAFGIANFEDGEEGFWISAGSVANGNLKRIYVISSVVPEPSTFVLWSILAGLGLVAVRRYRK